MKTITRAGVLAGFAALAAAPSASAAPVTVDLRVEGPTRTLVEQKVTVDVRRFKFSDSTTTYRCDGTGGGGSAPVASPTRNTALAQAAEAGGLELTGTWNTSFENPTFARISGESVAYDPSTFRYLREIKNDVDSMVGGCGDPIQDGDDVLYAYGDGSEALLGLSGPATVAPGQSATLTVTDQAAGTPVADATAGGQTSDANGKVVTAPLTQRGPNAFKASKTGTIRSNAVTVCVTDGADGFCGTSRPGAPPSAQPTAPPPSGPLFGGDDRSAFAKIGSIDEGQRFADGAKARLLKGTVDEDLVGVANVRLRLSRRDGKRCEKYNGVRERFQRTRRCSIKSSRTFSVGADRSWEYLLPDDLEPGRYVLDVIVIDKVGNQTKVYQRGRNRVVFYVD